jgi:hypothetical protein
MAPSGEKSSHVFGLLDLIKLQLLLESGVLLGTEELLSVAGMSLWIQVSRRAFMSALTLQVLMLKP